MTGVVFSINIDKIVHIMNSSDINSSITNRKGTTDGMWGKGGHRRVAAKEGPQTGYREKGSDRLWRKRGNKRDVAKNWAAVGMWQKGATDGMRQ